MRTGEHSEARTRLSGPWLLLARTTWVAVTALALATLLVLLPSMYRINLMQGYSWVNELQRLGLSRRFYGVVATALPMTVVVTCLAVASLIFWRRSADWLALFASLCLVTFGAVVGIEATVAPLYHRDWRWAVIFLRYFTVGALLIFLYIFPDGRFVPRWTRWLTVLWIGWGTAAHFEPRIVELFTERGLPGLTSGWLARYSLPWLAWYSTGVGAQLYRYWRVSSAIQRQQTKWVLAGFMAAFLGFTGFVLLAPSIQGLLFAPRDWVKFNVVIIAVTSLLLLLVPLSLGLAVLRARLWDIDVLVNRTLVYGTLTAVLASAYYGSVVLLQEIVRTLTGQATNQVAVVASTLAIAALFNPLRRRIQTFIDRRFYRRKYDAARTLEAFSAGIRNEVDLETVTASLLACVEQTMQPTHVSLWLREIPPAQQPES
ncbi:MAG: hypothetical protein M3380_15265 [Chloroflexota bacterium]|nr:hypothetical protein [Chloroflexota bacterium]